MPEFREIGFVFTVDKKGNIFIGTSIRKLVPVIPGPRDTLLGKIDYLMGRVNNIGSISKGKFFRGAGFDDDSLEQALKEQFAGPSNQVTFGITGIGQPKISITSAITSPTGKTVNVTSGWTIHPDGTATLNTTFPAK